MTSLDDSKQKTGKEQSSVMNTTNNALSDISVENKNKISGKLFIIIGIVIGLIFISVIVIVIVLANTKKKNHLFLEMILMIQEFFQMILMKEMKHQIVMM